MALKELSQFPLEEEYKKKTGITPEDIAELRRWLQTQPHLPSKYITDLDLILAYHACDCSTGVTKQVVDLHYTLRTLFTSYFKDRNFDSQLKRGLDTILITPLPTRTKEGYIIFYLTLIDCDTKHFYLTDCLRFIFTMLDIWQYKDGTWPGMIFLYDFQGVTLGHITKIDIQNVQQFLYYLQEALFVKLKGFHFMNAPSFIDKLLMLMRPFMKKELMDIFGIHTAGAESIKSVVSLEALPKDAGGEYKTYRECKEDEISLLQAGESYLKDENLKRVTESLRPGKPKTISDIFGGVEGSFKKLNLD